MKRCKKLLKYLLINKFEYKTGNILYMINILYDIRKRYKKVLIIYLLYNGELIACLWYKGLWI